MLYYWVLVFLKCTPKVRHKTFGSHFKVKTEGGGFFKKGENLSWFPPKLFYICRPVKIGKRYVHYYIP